MTEFNPLSRLNFTPQVQSQAAGAARGSAPQTNLFAGGVGDAFVPSAASANTPKLTHSVDFGAIGQLGIHDAMDLLHSSTGLGLLA